MKNRKFIANETSQNVDSDFLEAGQVVSAEEIAKRAYEIYESRGREEGSDLDDWLQAERELRPAPPAVRRAAAGSGSN